MVYATISLTYLVGSTQLYINELVACLVFVFLFVIVQCAFLYPKMLESRVEDSKLMAYLFISNIFFMYFNICIITILNFSVL